MYNRKCYRGYKQTYAVENSRWNGWKQYILGKISNFDHFQKMPQVWYKALYRLNGSQLAKMKKSIPDMSLP